MNTHKKKNTEGAYVYIVMVSLIRFYLRRIIGSILFDFKLMIDDLRISVWLSTGQSRKEEDDNLWQISQKMKNRFRPSVSSSGIWQLYRIRLVRFWKVSQLQAGSCKVKKKSKCCCWFNFILFWSSCSIIFPVPCYSFSWISGFISLFGFSLASPRP